MFCRQWSASYKVQQLQMEKTGLRIVRNTCEYLQGLLQGVPRWPPVRELGQIHRLSLRHPQGKESLL